MEVVVDAKTVVPRAIRDPKVLTVGAKFISVLWGTTFDYVVSFTVVGDVQTTEQGAHKVLLRLNEKEYSFHLSKLGITESWGGDFESPTWDPQRFTFSPDVFWELYDAEAIKVRTATKGEERSLEKLRTLV